jgi:hypothetical protein
LDAEHAVASVAALRFAGGGIMLNIKFPRCSHAEKTE